MSISLSEILALVGKLDDAPDEDAPRERFRQYLKKNVTEVGQVRDYVEECLRNAGVQLNHALQGPGEPHRQSTWLRREVWALPGGTGENRF